MLPLNKAEQLLMEKLITLVQYTAEQAGQPLLLLRELPLVLLFQTLEPPPQPLTSPLHETAKVAPHQDQRLLMLETIKVELL
jgi:hypothetical protein